MFCQFDLNSPWQSAGQSSAIQVCLLASNIRIDNYRDLLRALSLPRDCGLTDFLIGAWQRWGEDLPRHLRGAFAFVLADRSRNLIFAARDHFGLSPLFWRKSDNRVCFANTSREIRESLPGIRNDDILMLADFVAGDLIDCNRTFTEGIERFPHASRATISSGRIDVHRYWTFENTPRLRSADEAQAQFRALFDRSVAANVAEGKSAIMLSGGLDSSAIAAALYKMGRRPDHAYSVTYEHTRGWSDAEPLNAIAGKTGLTIEAVPADNHDPLQDMEFWLNAVDGPYLPRGHSVSMQLLRIAGEAGCDVVFNGHGGDEIVSYGFGRYNELAKAGNWLTLWRETPAAADLYGDNRLRIFSRYLSHIRSVRPLLRKLDRLRKSPLVVDGNFLNPEVTVCLDNDRYNLRTANSKLIHDERMLHEEALSAPLQPCSLEIFALCSEAAGVQTRMPFYDVELVEFSLSLPSEWKLRDGLSRYILRAAFAEELPREVRMRRDKFDFATPFINGLVLQQEKVLDLTALPNADPWGLVNKDRLQYARDKLFRDGTEIGMVDAAFLWRVAVLGIWAKMSPSTSAKSATTAKNGTANA